MFFNHLKIKPSLGFRPYSLFNTNIELGTTFFYVGRILRPTGGLFDSFLRNLSNVSLQDATVTEFCGN